MELVRFYIQNIETVTGTNHKQPIKYYIKVTKIL